MPNQKLNGSENYGMIRLTIMFLIIYVHWEVVLWTPINLSHLLITILSLLFCYSYQLWILQKKILLVLKKHFVDLHPHFSFPTFGFKLRCVFGHMACSPWICNKFLMMLGGLQLETVQLETFNPLFWLYFLLSILWLDRTYFNPEFVSSYYRSFGW